MIITVVIDNQSFEIDCDTGTQDIAWLSLCACNLYGQNTFPITTYLPILAKNQSGTILPPKLVIVKNMELIGEKIYVDVKRKANEIIKILFNTVFTIILLYFTCPFLGEHAFYHTKSGK